MRPLKINISNQFVNRLLALDMLAAYTVRSVEIMKLYKCSKLHSKNMNTMKTYRINKSIDKNSVTDTETYKQNKQKPIRNDNKQINSKTQKHILKHKVDHIFRSIDLNLRLSLNLFTYITIQNISIFVDLVTLCKKKITYTHFNNIFEHIFVCV